MRKILKIIFEDASAYIDYRNKVYSQNISWPNNRYGKLRCIYDLFKDNKNGFRDLLYYRLRNSSNLKKRIIRLIKFFYKPTNNLFIDVGDIEPGGCFFHHPFSSFINAEYIGKGCTFRNNTTIGNKKVNGVSYRPYFEENVFVGPNVTIIGKVRLGRNCIIGAGAVVTKDVPCNAVVVGNPGRIIRYNK